MKPLKRFGNNIYESHMVRMRYVDYMRIKKAFPPLNNEQTWAYFRRLGLFMTKYFIDGGER